jgi:DNA polymerase III alpha subunit (gram-positive type)
MVSYSLGRLCQSLGIDLDNRHRAGGDADYGNLVYSIISLGYYKGNGCNDKKTSRSAITT